MNSSTARNFRTYAAGFTLVELAMVLVILALLGGSLLVPLASRIEALCKPYGAELVVSDSAAEAAGLGREGCRLESGTGTMAISPRQYIYTSTDCGSPPAPGAVVTEVRGGPGRPDRCATGCCWPVPQVPA